MLGVAPLDSITAGANAGLKAEGTKLVSEFGTP